LNFIIFFLATTYKIADKVAYTTGSSLGLYNITMIASDNYFSVPRYYQLETQSKVNFSVSTTPLNPFKIDNDGSNE
jgi:hypothetical protein